MTPAIKEQIIKLRKDNRTLVEIRGITGQSDYAVYQVCRQAGLVEEGSKGPRSSSKVMKHKENILKMRAAGRTYKEIAEALPASDGITESQIGNTCRGSDVNANFTLRKNVLITFRRDDVTALMAVANKLHKSPEDTVLGIIRSLYADYQKLDSDIAGTNGS